MVSDDIYEQLLFDSVEFSTIAEAAPALYERTLTVNGVSKAYAMTAWRLGYAGEHKALIRYMTKMQSQSTSNPSSISQWAAVEALTSPQEFLHERAASFQRWRDLVLGMLEKTSGLVCARSQGAFYVFPNCAGTLGKKTPQGKTITTKLGTTLLNSKGVGTFSTKIKIPVGSVLNLALAPATITTSRPTKKAIRSVPKKPAVVTTAI